MCKKKKKKNESNRIKWGCFLFFLDISFWKVGCFVLAIIFLFALYSFLFVQLLIINYYFNRK